MKFKNLAFATLSLLMLTSCSNKTSSTTQSSTTKPVDSEKKESTTPTSTYDKTKKKETTTLGSYPQSKVTDETKIASLNQKAGTLPTASSLGSWKDYGYYNNSKVEAYTFYIDIDEDSDGKNDYRGVYFTKYRPFAINKNSDDLKEFTQKENGYNTNTVYWFKYESIKWDILDKDKDGYSYLLSPILDVQAYNNTIEDRTNVKDYQGNTSTGTVLANNYKYSNIRNYLNTTFYNLAFTSSDKTKISDMDVKNSASYTGSSSEFVCEDTKDKVFLLSYTELYSYYNSDNAEFFSDYSASLGLQTEPDNGKHTVLTWTRTLAASSKEMVTVAADEAYSRGGFSVQNYTIGMRAAIKVKL